MSCHATPAEPVRWPPLDRPPYPGGVSGSLVDLVLIVLIVMFAVNGYRQGFMIGALSFLGFFG
jgi:hypothetical protein